MAGEEIHERMIDRGQANMLYGAEVRNGAEVYKGGGLGVVEHVIVNPETQNATHTRLEHPYFTEPVHVTAGLHIGGIFRKTSWFARRQLVEGPIEKGDQLRLVDSVGDEYTRMKVKKDWGAVLRAKVERLTDEA